jgi:hypothetical protein
LESGTKISLLFLKKVGAFLQNAVENKCNEWENADCLNILLFNSSKLLLLPPGACKDFQEM